MAESFFSSLKKERIKKQIIYKNRELAKADVADYIDIFTIGLAVTATSEG